MYLLLYLFYYLDNSNKLFIFFLLPQLQFKPILLIFLDYLYLFFISFLVDVYQHFLILFLNYVLQPILFQISIALLFFSYLQEFIQLLLLISLQISLTFTIHKIFLGFHFKNQSLNTLTRMGVLHFLNLILTFLVHVHKVIKFDLLSIHHARFKLHYSSNYLIFISVALNQIH